MYKTASDIADTVLTKCGFAVTEAGHQSDAASAEAAKEYMLARLRASQAYEERRKSNPGYFSKKWSRNVDSMSNPNGSPYGEYYRPAIKARHDAYVAQKHQEGKNAWNPWGGRGTPLPEEEGGNWLRQGRIAPREAAPEEMPEEMPEEIPEEMPQE